MCAGQQALLWEGGWLLVELCCTAALRACRTLAFLVDNPPGLLSVMQPRGASPPPPAQLQRAAMGDPLAGDGLAAPGAADLEAAALAAAEAMAAMPAGAAAEPAAAAAAVEAPTAEGP